MLLAPSPLLPHSARFPDAHTLCYHTLEMRPFGIYSPLPLYAPSPPLLFFPHSNSLILYYTILPSLFTMTPTCTDEICSLLPLISDTPPPLPSYSSPFQYHHPCYSLLPPPPLLSPHFKIKRELINVT